MRSIIKTLAVNTAALYILSLAIPAITFSGGFKTYLTAAFVLLLLNFLVKPVLNLILLPLNILTLGMFRWVTSTIILWLGSVFVQGLHIGVFLFAGFSYQGIMLPPMELSVFWTTVVAAFLFSIATSFLEWIIDS